VTFSWPPGRPDRSRRAERMRERLEREGVEARRELVDSPRLEPGLLEPLPAHSLQRRRLHRLDLQHRWEHLEDRPYVEIEPVPTLGDPIVAGDWLLWPDVAGGRVFFSLREPVLRDFSLTVRQEQVDGALRTQGGTAVVTVSAYRSVEAAQLVALQGEWAGFLRGHLGGDVVVRFEALSLRSLDARLDVGGTVLATEPRATVSSEAGTATFLLELSPSGAVEWQQALERRAGHAITGVCALKAQYYAQLAGGAAIRSQQLDVPLGKLLAGAGPESLSLVNPEVSFETNVIVSGHPTVKSVVVNWMPNEGRSPESVVFDGAGGRHSAVVTSRNPRGVAVDWNVRAQFHPHDWPEVQQSGRLSVAANELTATVKPSLWVAEYAVSVLLLDQHGTVIPAIELLDPSSRVQIVLTYRAPYLPGGTMRSVFETESQHMVKAAFPKPPDQPTGDVRLWAFAQRGAAPRWAERVLTPEESLVAILVGTDSSIRFVTDRDPAPETSKEAVVLGRMAALR
jgi:hypothetical protein